MITQSGLRQLNLEVAAAACYQENKPLPMTNLDWNMILSGIRNGAVPEVFRHMPNVGNPEHLGEITGYQWEIVDSIFHDITGYDLRDAGGPAASILQLAEWGANLTEEHGSLYFCLGDCYQFQGTTFALKKLGPYVPPTAEPGSVSHGTMRPADLIPAFLSVLQDLQPVRAQALQDDYMRDADVFDTESWEEWCDENEDAHWMLDCLFDVLNELAPDGCYFGAHPGDSADYGFWEAEDV